MLKEKLIRPGFEVDINFYSLTTLLFNAPELSFLRSLSRTPVLTCPELVEGGIRSMIREQESIIRVLKKSSLLMCHPEYKPIYVTDLIIYQCDIFLLKLLFYRGFFPCNNIRLLL